MKIKNLIAASVVAVLAVTSGSAATAVNTPDAILLGFRATADATVGANTFLFVGLDGLQNQSFAFNQQLTTQFGSDWYSNGYIRWGVYGLNMSTGPNDDGFDANGNPIYGTTTVGSIANSGLALADGNWDYVTAAGNLLDTTKNNLFAEGLSDTSGGYSFGVLTGGDATVALGLAPAFQGLLSGRGASYPGEFDLSVITSLDINRYLPNGTIDGFGSYSIPGIVSVSSVGQITVVPEPSTYALLGLGAVIGLVAKRRAKRA
jgi:hypothetical protein